MDEKQPPNLFGLIELMIISGVVVLAGVLIFETWRKDWTKPVAGLLLGVVFGYGSLLAGGDFWVVIWTLVGAIAGPNILIMLQGQKFTEALMSVILQRLGNQESKKGTTSDDQGSSTS